MLMAILRRQYKLLGFEMVPNPVQLVFSPETLLKVERISSLESLRKLLNCTKTQKVKLSIKKVIRTKEWLHFVCLMIFHSKNKVSKE